MRRFWKVQLLDLRFLILKTFVTVSMRNLLSLQTGIFRENKKKYFFHYFSMKEDTFYVSKCITILFAKELFVETVTFLHGWTNRDKREVWFKILFEFPAAVSFNVIRLLRQTGTTGITFYHHNVWGYHQEFLSSRYVMERRKFTVN